MSWCRTATGSWLVFGLLLAGGTWFAVYASLCDPTPQSARDDLGCVFALVYLTALGAVLGLAIGTSSRRLTGWWYRRHPERIAELVTRLDAPSYLDRLQAVQALAEVYGEPFGPVSYGCCTAEQVEALRLLYREWWRAHHGAGQPSSGEQREALMRRVIARMRALREAEALPGFPEVKHVEHADLAELRPIPVEPFVAALRPRAEELLRRVAGLLNLVSPAANLIGTEAKIRRLFARLCWEACEYGWGLRFDAVEGWAPAPASAATPAPPSPPPLAPVPPSLGWAVKYRRLSGTDPVEAAPADQAERPGGRDQMTWAELAAALHRKVDATLDQLADVVKDTILDGELPAASEDDPALGPLVPLSREQFVEAMRLRIEDALRGMADSLNDSGGADRVGDLLEVLLRDALQTGLEMRSQARSDGRVLPQESLQ